MKKLTGIIFLIIALGTTAIINAQTKDITNQFGTDAANEVLRKAKHAVYGDISTDKINGFYLKRFGSAHIQTISVNDDGTTSIAKDEDRKNDDEISLQLPGKAKITSTAYSLEDNPSENYLKIESILNEFDSVDKSDIYRNGRKVDINVVLSRVPSAFYEQVKSALAATKEKKQKSSENMIGWIDIFPIILSNPWNPSVKLNWIGKTQYEGAKADVLETVFDNNSSAKFLFDEKSSLLSLIIFSTVSDNGFKEEKRISFTNYDKFDGMTISKKIKIEKISTTPKREIVFEGIPHKTQERKVKEVNELTVKEFKLNPELKNNLFNF